MKTIELSDAAYERLCFLSAKIGEPVDRHCVEWVENKIMTTRTEESVIEETFHRCVDRSLREGGNCDEPASGRVFTAEEMATDWVEEDKDDIIGNGRRDYFCDKWDGVRSALAWGIKNDFVRRVEEDMVGKDGHSYEGYRLA